MGLLNTLQAIHYTDCIGQYAPSAGTDHVKDIFGHTRDAPCLGKCLQHSPFQLKVCSGLYDPCIVGLSPSILGMNEGF